VAVRTAAVRRHRPGRGTHRGGPVHRFLRGRPGRSRDIGTAVFPDAEVKIFLDAAPEVRGNRRFRQATPESIAVLNSNGGKDVGRQAPDPLTAEQQRLAEEAVIRELKERDYRDRHRAESPLQPAADAVILDSTSMTLDQVLTRAEEIVRSHLPT